MIVFACVVALAFIGAVSMAVSGVEHAEGNSPRFFGVVGLIFIALALMLAAS